MSWSYGTIHERGLILKEQDFKELLKISKTFKEENELTDEEIDDMFEGDLQDYAYDLGMYPCFATICDIDRLVGFNENGEGQYDNIDTIQDDTIYVLWLRKDNLLNCYKDYDEIIKEIENNIVTYFDISIETVYEKLGVDFIKDRLGLANGFYSER